MNRQLLLACALAGTIGAATTNAYGADEALLQILLQNKLITQAQYDAINQTAAKPASTAAGPGATGQRLPGQDEGLLDVLLANGLISQQQYAALQVKNADDRAKKQETKEAKITLGDGLKFKSVDGDFTAQLGAYAQMDSAWYDDDGTDLSDGTELRRARLSMSGTVLRDWDYKVEADFAGTTQGGSTNTVSLTDAYLRYNGFHAMSFTAGNFKVPFSLEAVSSGKYITFMERGLPFAFLNLRSLGGMAATAGNNWTAALGLFGNTVTSQNADDEGKSAAARVTFAPVYRKDRALHLGFAAQIRAPDQNASGSKRETVRFRSKPESNISSDGLFECSTVSATNTANPDPAVQNCVPANFGGTGGFGRSSGRLVDTGNISGDVNYYSLLGAEAAAIYGPFSVQGEYMRAYVNRELSRDAAFNGYYVYGSFFLTGESRNYRADKGTFDILQPEHPFSAGGGWGAWEVAVRFSSIDLNDEDVNGGRMQDLTVGLNWYPNAFMRLAANYVNVLDVNGGTHDGEDINAFQVRAQVSY